jgi:hypothetical protein
MAIARSTALSERGKASGGSGKLKTATSSLPTSARDARRPNGMAADCDDSGTREPAMAQLQRLQGVVARRRVGAGPLLK